MKKAFNQETHQRGAILLIALVMLLLLTVIGLSGIRGTTLQENMANNLRESNLSYQAAEAALQMGVRIARSTFNGCDFDENLQDQPNIEGAYSGFKNVAKAPEYSIVTLKLLPGEGESGHDNYRGILVRIDATGFGLNTDTDGEPVSQTQLRATYRIECTETVAIETQSLP
ncbi:MAG TPA: PilX N-terminal domain-containing pilus assembly protein [Thiopseudomonas sp.]|nr:PilX N-terminal domain-containing pilus assembly protein [Thiopseudomonas sp.]